MKRPIFLAGIVVAALGVGILLNGLSARANPPAKQKPKPKAQAKQKPQAKNPAARRQAAEKARRKAQDRMADQMKQHLDRQKRLLKMMSDQRVVSLMAIDKIKQLAVRTKEYSDGAGALNQVARKSPDPAIRRAAMFAMSELQVLAGDVAEAMGTLARACEPMHPMPRQLPARISRRPDRPVRPGAVRRRAVRPEPPRRPERGEGEMRRRPQELEQRLEQRDRELDRRSERLERREAELRRLAAELDRRAESLRHQGRQGRKERTGD